jgi:hypothetical protein
MREIRAYGSVGVSAGNRRHYPAITEGRIGTTRPRITGQRTFQNAEKLKSGGGAVICRESTQQSSQ